jgi:hypothetical protein
LIAEEKEFDRKFCRRYYRENLRFGFGEEERAGLREFHKRCLQQRLLPERTWRLEPVIRGFHSASYEALALASASSEVICKLALPSRSLEGFDRVRLRRGYGATLQPSPFAPL